MRFKLSLELKPQVMGRAIPINYQYELTAAIYKIMAKADSKYSMWLHDNGFISGNKKFKLFTFSHLIVPNYTIDKQRQRLIINSDYVEWYITFLPEKSTRQFIYGIFQEQTIEISDLVSGAAFRVREVQVMPSLEYAPVMEMETMSPICVSQRNGQGKTDYLSPESSCYSEGLLTGLLSKYRAMYGYDYNGAATIDFRLLGQSKPVLVKIKANTPEQTFVKGYQYRFRISLPEPLMQIAYESGLGEKCSMGFGMIKIK